MRAPVYLCLLTAMHLGCAAPLASTHVLSSPKSEASDKPVEAGQIDEVKANAIRKATTEPPTQEQALADIFDELEKIRAIDPDGEREVMEDLRKAKPEHYAIIVDAFGKALAYRQQLATRQMGASPSAELAALPGTESSRGPDGKPGVSQEQGQSVTTADVPTKARRVRSTSAPPPTSATASIAEDNVQPAGRSQEPTAASDSARSDALAMRVEAAVAKQLPAAAPLPSAKAASPAIPSDEQPYAVSREVVQASALSTGNWQADLTTAIADLERTLNPTPASTAELHDHMRLRTLQLLAGREEEAYRPIPGASPAQQDYWAKQLFAMAAYLNSGGKLDDKQRAAAALAPFDEARAKLSELATLQIRNASFVASVDGYGSYEPQKQTAFQPGQKVILYAEVENFTSNAAEDGYHTSLGTSYQVLDSNRRRIDAKQFPDVGDNCRNRRRDFHMQYEFALPTRIYPGEYELELTITDHNSGKIGQATVPFQVAGDAKP